MAVSGFADGPPQIAPGMPATYVFEQLEQLRLHSLSWGHGLDDDADERLLGERAALAQFGRNAPFSPGGAFRILPSRDGFVGLSLARASDIELLPALVSGIINDPWNDVATWFQTAATADAVERGRLLGLPIAPIDPPAQASPAVTRTIGGRRAPAHAPLIVDFSSLWAGPLSAQLLAACGAHVVKVESCHRPDGARHGSADFYRLLHGTHDSVSVDPTNPDDRARLAALVARADVVIEASRPRALAQWGLSAEDAVRSGTIWAGITAYGRDIDAVGFGDDVAAAGGLWRREGRSAPFVVGDAIADPLTGVTAAAAIASALTSDRSSLLDICMVGVAQAARGDGALPEHDVVDIDGSWWVDDGSERFMVAAPHARPLPQSVPAAMGRDNEKWLSR